jgi:DNA-binding transcriptional LysR family regulator
VISLVAAGVGVSLVPQGAAAGQVRRGVVFIPLSPPALMAPLTVVWREDDVSPALRRFLAVVDIECVRLGTGRPGIRATSEK